MFMPPMGGMGAGGGATRDIKDPDKTIVPPSRPNSEAVKGESREPVRHTATADAGLFVTSAIAWDKALQLVLGGRYDAYNVRSLDLGVMSFAPARGRDNAGRFTGSASLSYKTDWGLIPYVTTARSSAVEIGQAGEVSTSLLSNGG